MTRILNIPLAQIMADALPRDRATLNPAELAELQSSIATEGLRQPIEVWRLTTPEAGCRYGLISGLRRLTATRNLAQLRPEAWTTIPAFLRVPKDFSAALAAMVAENEIRADITPWEKGLLIMNAVDEKIFATPDAAVTALYPYATLSTKSRLRTIAGVVHDLSGCLTDPTVYSLRQLLRIAAALKADFAEVIVVALRECPDRSQPVQWDLLQNILSEAEHSLTEPQKPQAPGRPRRLLYPRPNLIIRRERIPNGYRLTFTGREAQGMMMDSVLDQIERMYKRV